MRFPVDHFRRRATRIGLVALSSTALVGCASHGGGDDFAALAQAPAGARQAASDSGPAADYPLVIGDPYQVGSQLYTPADTLNYDEVGYASAQEARGFSGAHHTLPLPSYVEVTSLDSGKTILVRLESRGPMSDNSLVGLSPAAMAQLGARPGVPVRVRRVNPPEEERAMLRADQSARARMDTPESLLAVLKRKLPASGSTQLASAASPKPLVAVPVAPSSAGRPVATTQAQQQVGSRTLPAPALPPLPASVVAPGPERTYGGSSTPRRPVEVASVSPRQAESSRMQSRPEPAPQVSADGQFIVQVAALSSLDRAKRVANVIGGNVSQTGSLYRIRTGPFVTRGQAEASLAKVRAAGYSDARIFTNG